MAVGQNQWYHFGVGAPPILEPILVGIANYQSSNVLEPTGAGTRSSAFGPGRIEAKFRSGIQLRFLGVPSIRFCWVL